MAQMKWYTTLRNSINKIEIPKDQVNTIVVGNKNICQKICDMIIQKRHEKESACAIAMDGYLGAEWGPVVKQVVGLLQKQGLKSKVINVTDLYKSGDWVETLMRKHTAGDPSFGIVCSDKLLEDFLDGAKMKGAIKSILEAKKERLEPAVVLCHGIGSAVRPIRRACDLVFFFDLGRVSVMKRLFAGKLREPGRKEPERIFWKRMMYVWHHILNKHRKDVLESMDGYVDGNDAENLKLIPRNVYDAIVRELAQCPLVFQRFMQPGNWGGLKHRKYFNLPQLKNCAWDTAFYPPKNSCLVDLGIGSSIEIPFLNIQLRYSRNVCGPYLAKKYPGLLPLIACIDDGYFPKPVHHERSNMPIHLHPDNEYARRNFNERLGRYETYYIVEAYKNANTMLGFCQNADIDEFKQKILNAEERGVKFDWTKYVKMWHSKAGDLYLIPAGTVHGTGGHQMILEMDTCPSNVGTEYSFFMYDFLRQSWDDDKKSFSAPPVRLQIKHGFNQIRRQRREKWVKKNLLAKPNVIRKGKGWSEDRYDSFSPMPFIIERMHFDKKITGDTNGRFCHLICLTKGDRAIVRSKKHPEKKIELEWIQFAFIPAGFGKYECINTGKAPSCTIVKERWKRG